MAAAARAPRHYAARDALTAALEAALDARDGAGAIAACEVAIARDGDDAGAHRHLALLLAADGRLSEALAAGKRACALAPDDARSWVNLGRVHALGDLLDDAVLC